MVRAENQIRLDSDWIHGQHHPCPLVPVWLNPTEFEFVFEDRWPEEEPLSKIAFKIRRRSPIADDSLLPPPMEPAKGYLSRLTFVYRVGSISMPEADRRKAATFLACLYSATSAYSRQLNMARKLGQRLRQNRSQPSAKLDQAEVDAVYSAMIVFLASSLEVGLSDCFFVFQGLWFTHLPSKKIPQAFSKLMDDLGLGFDSQVQESIQELSRLGWPIEKVQEHAGSCLKGRRISFQGLKNKRGPKTLYQAVFGIPLADLMGDTGQLSWQALIEALEHRHGIVHQPIMTSTTGSDIFIASSMIQLFFGKLLDEISGRFSIDRNTFL